MNFTEVLVSLGLGFLTTLKLFGITLVCSLPLGLIITFGLRSRFKPLSWLCSIFVWIIRGSPLLLQLLLFTILPNALFGVSNKELATFFDCKVADVYFILVCAAFIINYACYFSVIFKGALDGIPKGQYEAGKVLGLKKGQIFSQIVLFQLIRRTLAPVSNETITLVKDTALASSFSVFELLAITDSIVNKFVTLTPLVYAAVFYLLFNGLLTLLFGYLEKKMSFYKE